MLVSFSCAVHHLPCGLDRFLFHPYSCSSSIRMRSRPVLSLPHMFSHALTTPLHPETHKTQASGLHSRLSRAPKIANVWWRRRLSANKTGCSLLLWSKPRVWLIIIFASRRSLYLFFLFTSPYVFPHLCRIFYFWVVFIFARLIVPTLRSETRSALHQRDWSAFKEKQNKKRDLQLCVCFIIDGESRIVELNLICVFVTFRFVGMTRMLCDNEIWTPLGRFGKWKMLKLLLFFFSIRSVISCRWPDLADLRNWKAGKTSVEQRWRCLPCKQMPLHMRVCVGVLRTDLALIAARFQISHNIPISDYWDPRY